jgi:hypothetical protein
MSQVGLLIFLTCPSIVVNRGGYGIASKVLLGISYHMSVHHYALLGEVCMNVRVLVLGSTSTHECRSTGTWVGVLVLFTYF